MAGAESIIGVAGVDETDSGSSSITAGVVTAAGAVILFSGDSRNNPKCSAKNHQALAL